MPVVTKTLRLLVVIEIQHYEDRPLHEGTLYDRARLAIEDGVMEKLKNNDRKLKVQVI